MDDKSSAFGIKEQKFFALMYVQYIGLSCSWDVFFTILHLELCGLHWHLPYLSSTHGVFRVDPISSVELRCVFINLLSRAALIVKIILWCWIWILCSSSSSRMESMHVSLILIGGGNLCISDGCFYVGSLESFLIYVCIFFHQVFLSCIRGQVRGFLSCHVLSGVL